MTISTHTSTIAAPSLVTKTAAAPDEPAASASTAATGSAATPAAASSAPQSPSTSVTLSALAAEANIVATLDSRPNAFQTYDATGLLNLVAQAGTAAASAGGNAASAGTASGDWSTILKSNPGLAPVAVGYAVTQDIVNTLSTYA